MSKPSPLTDEQADKVADRIAQTTQNIYRVAEEILGRRLKSDEMDVTYKHVEMVGKIFKCAECNVWKADSEVCGWQDDMCVECEDQQDKDDA